MDVSQAESSKLIIWRIPGPSIGAIWPKKTFGWQTEQESKQICWSWLWEL